MLQNESELFGRTIRVNLAKPQKAKEGSSRAVWADDEWLKKYAGATLDGEGEEGEEAGQGTESSKRPATETVCIHSPIVWTAMNFSEILQKVILL